MTLVVAKSQTRRLITFQLFTIECKMCLELCLYLWFVPQNWQCLRVSVASAKMKGNYELERIQ